MASYFRQVPDLEYVSRLPDSKIGDYIRVKNLFKKGKIRDDIFQDLAFFQKYKIVGDDRPDNVAYEIYKDAKLDWVILLTNNIINIQTEWPLPQNDFDEYLLDKYGDYNTLFNGVHHYETREVKNNQGVTVIPKGLEVSSPYPVSYYDFSTDVQISLSNIAVPVTNYEYEEEIENKKRNIFILKPIYLGVILNDMSQIMEYKKGSSQYVSEDLKRADNIKLYE